jgi:hypothetical protein
MKKIYFTFYILIFIIPLAVAQIPNGGFELWNAAGNDITGWESTNGLSQLGNPQTIYRSTNAYSGTYACEINTKKIIAKPPGVYIPDYSGSMFVGKQISVRSIPGFPYTERPEKFTFWYQYNARNNDSATSLILLTKWNTPLNKRDTVAISYNLITDSVGIYTKKEALLTYFDPLTRPDTAIIYFSSATNHANKEGARFLLDELNLVGGTVGLQEKNNAAGLAVFPNPSPNGFMYVSVRTEIKMEQIIIYNINGSKVWQTENFNGDELQINTQLPAGLYLLELRHSKGFETKKIAIE